MPTPQNKYTKKGFEEVHTLSEFVNIPALMNKARRNELRRMGIPPINYTPPTRKQTKKSMTPNQIRKFEANLARSLESNKNNNFLSNLSYDSNGSIGTDPKVNSRAPSPGFKGGRTRRLKKKRHTRKH